ncbi:conserved hypothetical protein, secreted [Candidatus Magnetomorum sp. HK-1]|nr:conserved hypothetical protein, secreted [Candidatus Magnetomorum sp. HK-1]
MKNQIYCIFLLAVCVLSITQTDLWAETSHWQKMSSPVTQNLNAIWGRSRSDIYAVGNKGIILHYDGNTWRNLSSPVQTDLYAIWGNETDIYIVGANGVILKREYQIWAPMTSGTENDLLDIWGITDTDIIAVGKKGTILRNTSGVWFEMASRTLSTLNSVWGTAGPVYACGSGGKLLQLTDNRWNTLTGQTFNTLNSLWGESDNYFYTVGASGVILKYQSGTWTETIFDSFMNLNAVWGFSDGKVFAAGYNGTVLFHDISRPEWTTMNADTSQTINDIWGTSSQDVYAVGEQGLILHLKQNLIISGPLEVNETDFSANYKIHLVYALNENLLVSLKSSDPNSISVPEELIIPAGTVEFTFKSDIIDDIDIDGNTYVTLTADAEHWYSGSLMVLVIDNEIKNIKLTVPEIASEGNGVMNDAGQVSIPGIFQDSLTIHLTSNKTDKVIVPGTIEIEAGQQVAHFDMTIVDNNIMDGMIPVLISASAPGWQPVTSIITIADNEGAQLSVTVIEKAIENSGLIENSAWVTLDSVLLNDFEVSLSSDNTALVETPYTLIIPAGKTIAMFDLTVKNDNWISGPKSVKIKVEARGWYSGYDTVVIEDNDPKNLSLYLPSTANETDGVLTNTARISIPGYFSSDIMIELLNSSPENLKIPQFVLLPHDQHSVFFTITVIDNSIISDELSQIITLTAITPGWLTDSAQISIMENEEKTLGLWVIEDPQEDNGNIPHAGTVYIPGTYHESLTVYLEVSNTDRVSIPDQIQIDAGQVSKTFDMTFVDDNEIGEEEQITIIALAPGWDAITSVTTLKDNEKKELSLSIPLESTEGKGLLLNAGKIEIPGIYRYDLAISLSVNQNNQIKIPETLLIHAGGTSVLFDIEVIDNDIIDLRQGVSVNAKVLGLDGWKENDAIIHINDNESKYLSLSLVSEITEGAGFYRNIGNINIPGRFIYDLPVYITTNNAAKIQPPETVILPKGYTQLAFDCLVLDNNEVDGETLVNLTAFSPGWAYSEASIQINDDENYQLAIQMPDQLVEGSGLYTNIAWIVADGIVPSDIPIAMNHSQTVDLALPPIVILKQGSTSVPFDLTINDNFAIDASRSITISATPFAPYTKWKAARSAIEIIDNEPQTVLISVPEIVKEGVGNLSAKGSVQISGYMEEPLWVQLTVLPDTDIAVSKWLTITSGATQSTFDLFINDNNSIEGPQKFQIMAAVNLPGWTGSSSEIILEDNDIRQLTLTVPETAQEGIGTLTNSGQILLSGTLKDDLKVQLTSSDLSRLSLPQWVMIPSEHTIVTFDLTFKNNYWIEGNKAVFIYAYAKNFPVAKAQTLILDNEISKLNLWILPQAEIGAGLLSNAGLVSIPGIYNKDLEINLVSENSDIVSIYQTQIIPSGQSMTFFDLFVSDQMTDTSQLISISVQADNFQGNTKNIRIKSTNAPINGDLNNDGQINLIDIITGLQAISGIFHDQVLTHADVDNDDIISLIDVLFLFEVQ